MAKRFIPTIKVSGDIENNNVYLTSGIQPPADDGTIFQQITTHSEMQSYASGGSIFHMNVNEHMPADKTIKMIKNMFNKFPLRYISITPILSICQECGCKAVGKKTTCTSCGSTDISLHSRPVGYFRPVMRGNISQNLKKSNHRFWAKSRIEEFIRRRTVDNDSVDSLLLEKSEMVG